MSEAGLNSSRRGSACSPESRPQAHPELLTKLGNFVNRIIKFAIAKYDSVIPDPKNGEFDYATEAYEWAAEDRAFVDDVNKLLASYIDQLDHQKIRAALSTLMHISARGKTSTSRTPGSTTRCSSRTRRARPRWSSSR